MSRFLKILVPTIFFGLFIFLCPYNLVFAGEEVLGGKTYTYEETDDGSNSVSIESVKFRITCYGDLAGGRAFSCGVSPDIVKMGKGDLNAADIYDKYTWGYIEIDGEKYVALAGALRYEIPNSWWGGAERAGRKYNHIFYFDTKQTSSLDDCAKIQFRFLDNSGDGFHDPEVYNGIVVDSGPMMLPQLGAPDVYKEDENALDIYCGADGETIGKTMSISTQLVTASMDGTFSSSSSNKTTEQDKIGLVEFILDTFTKYINLPLGDTIQKILDQAGTDLTDEEAKKILYSRQDLESLNNRFHNEIQVDNVNSTKETDTIKQKYLSNLIQNKNGENEEIYTSATYIPVIPIDAYTMTATKVNLFDINFINNINKDNESENLGDLYRNLINTLSHIIMYICAALLIGMLIWRSILFIKSIYGDDSKIAEKSKKIMDNYIKAILIIVGVFLFSSLMINLYYYATSLITNESSTFFPIRLLVKSTYSFNTNIISAVRYHTLSTNILNAYGWSLLYLVTALANLLWFIFMFIRMIVLGALIAIAPITAITTMGETVQSEGAKTIGLFFIRGWIKVFLIVLWIPFCLTVLMNLAFRL